MDDRNQELISKIDLLLEMMVAMRADLETVRGDVATLKADVATLKADVATLKKDVAEIKIEQRQMGDRITRLEGRSEVLITWLQSVDQRFMALMAPVAPPRKPAA